MKITITNIDGHEDIPLNNNIFLYLDIEINGQHYSIGEVDWQLNINGDGVIHITPQATNQIMVFSER